MPPSYNVQQDSERAWLDGSLGVRKEAAATRNGLVDCLGHWRQYTTLMQVKFTRPRFTEMICW